MDKKDLVDKIVTYVMALMIVGAFLLGIFTGK